MDESWKQDGQKAITQRRRIAPRNDAISRAEADLWAVDHRGKPAIKPPPQAGLAMARVLRPLARAFGPGVSELEEHWSAIVGEALARWSSPEKLQAGALVVRARGPAAALIEAQSAVILERVAQYAGKTPRRLRIVQGSLAAPAGPVRRAASQVIRRSEPLPEPPADPAERLAAALADFEAAVREREGRR
ncbi:MAG: DciA family protein [Caulobacterales bacterium]|uniref:DciA family protein n=1 Tax=Glycocaulis sp. TaxID=1969725 RepID=UPI003FA0CE70